MCSYTSFLSLYVGVWPDLWPTSNPTYLWLNFMIQWFCLISHHSISIWAYIFHNMSKYDPTFDNKLVLRPCDLISWLSDFVLYLNTLSVNFQTSFRLWISATKPLNKKYVKVTITLFHVSVILIFILYITVKTSVYQNLIKLVFSLIWNFTDIKSHWIQKLLVTGISLYLHCRVWITSDVSIYLTSLNVFHFRNSIAYNSVNY